MKVKIIYEDGETFCYENIEKINANQYTIDLLNNLRMRIYVAGYRHCTKNVLSLEVYDED